MNFTGKNVDAAISKGLDSLGVTKEDVIITVIQEGKAGLLGLLGTKEAIVSLVPILNSESPINPDTQKSFTNDLSEAEKEAKLAKAKNFLIPLLKELDYQVECFFREDGEFIKVDIRGERVGNLIGKRGETLYGIQYLLNLVANRNDDNNLKFIVDIENFREKREKTLLNLAKRLAEKVKETGKPASLEPMNPLERKIIHMALQDDDLVKTISVGSERDRHITIILKEKTQN